MDLLNTYTHYSEIQALTALSLISSLYKSPQHPAKPFLNTYTHYSEIQALTALSLISSLYKSPQHPAKPFSILLCLQNPFPGNGFNSGDSSASRAQVLSSQSPVQNSTLN
jgi:hypothetical protein